jgi:hypothetical protein
LIGALLGIICAAGEELGHVSVAPSPALVQVVDGQQLNQPGLDEGIDAALRHPDYDERPQTGIAGNAGVKLEGGKDGTMG